MEMNLPVGPNTLDSPSVVGGPIDRVDGRLKVTGGARYADEMQQEKVLYGFVVEASIGSGAIEAISTRVLRKRRPELCWFSRHATRPPKAPAIIARRTRCWSGPASHVLRPAGRLRGCRKFRKARAAAYLVDVKYDRQNGKYALRNNLHEARVPKPNDAPAADSAVGDFADAFTNAPVQIDATYTTPLQSHAMMEPHATLAMWDGDEV